MVRSMMSQTTLSKSFWDYALETVAHILNMVLSKKVKKTPYEVWHGQATKLSYLKVWGCEALVKQDTLTKPDNLEPRSIKCIFVGYPKETMGYYFYYPPKNKVLVAWNAEFLENSLITQEASGSLEDLEIIQEEDTHPSINTSSHNEEDDLEIDEPQSDIIPIRRSTRIRHAPDRMCLYVDAEEHELGDLSESANYKVAFKTIGSKWLFKKKTNMDGDLHTFKARLVVKARTAFYDYEICQMDVKTAFLNGYLSEEVYMEKPKGFVNPKYPNRVCKLKHSIYGLKQASRQWNKRFDDEIKKFGFTQNCDEPCVYLKASGSNVTFLIFFIDISSRVLKSRFRILFDIYTKFLLLLFWIYPRRNKQEELFTHKEEMAPMALSDSKYDDLLVKLDDTGFKAATYKRGLATLEGQIVKYREHEVLFSEEIALLKRSVGSKEYQLGLLRTELEKVKQEKEGVDLKIAKFDKSAKDLDQLLGSQITDNSKKGLGYSAVPPPHPLIYNRPNM
ncbi:retrotransposon protein, putative, ty1-copia subclass [Tanacetum coccineum]